MTQMPPMPPTATPPMVSKRPGGLTALAVLNFVFGGMGVIGSIMALLAGMAAAALVGIAAKSADAEGARVASEVAKAAAPSIAGMVVLLLLSIVLAALLIVSGVGYLKQKKMLGKTLGNVYAIAAIATFIIQLIINGLGGFFGILGVVYPIITLALLNTSFKNSFPNP